MATFSNIGWQFDNSYARLPEIMMSRVNPVKVISPKLILLNNDLSKELGLNFGILNISILELFH